MNRSRSLWGRTKLDWLRGFLTLEFGIPSHDTFGRVFAALNGQDFEAAFRQWVGHLIPALGQDTVVAIDGKSVRRSTSKLDQSPLHLVSAFAAGAGLVLGQRATAAKSNEITAIPELLATLAIEGCIVTLDAMGTQTKTAHAMRTTFCASKTSPPKLCDSLVLAHAQLTAQSSFEREARGHGRHENRRCWAYASDEHLYQCAQWLGLQSFAVVERVRTLGGKTSTERAYYLSSLPPDAQRLAQAVRSHWEIENRLHWCLDVQFCEDQSRARTDNAAHTLALTRHIAMNLMRLNSRKVGFKNKRLLAASDDQFPAELLGLI